MNDFGNTQVAALPAHLRQYIVEQNYERYTPIDQAVWRYVMRQNYSYLKDVAYYPYIPGLKAAGLTIEYIPRLHEMNDALGRIGWGAVTVDGFIPPAAFMEYQAYRVLVIAADIRQLQHIAYTPAPDIIHESAGHAPIIADPDYHRYLSYFGAIGAKAMYSAQDYELYEAIRALSILKEMPDADPIALLNAEEQVTFCQQNMGEPSEMALLSRLHWWTVEYGLIGTLEDPKIYGAGLLSSIGESAGCMRPEVKKLWYTLDAVNYSYDITRPQEQLFVTPNFRNLVGVLEQFADGMAFRQGGASGLRKALDSKNVCTIVYSSGLQVSGVLCDFKIAGGVPAFIRTGPAQLCFENKQLEGHGKTYHNDGFSSPSGKLKGSDMPLEYWSVEPGRLLVLHFESGILLMGTVLQVFKRESKNILISFSGCSVMDRKGECLFDPSWGVYDLAIGERIVSVYSGAADKQAFEEMVYRPKTTTYHPVAAPETLALQQLYKRVRLCREECAGYERLPYLWQQLYNHHRGDWLCAAEILEILVNVQQEPELALEIRAYLAQQTITQPELKKLISNALRLIRAAG